MKCPKYDFHIHTKYLHPGSDAGISDIVNECKRLGVVSLAITDHLNSFDELELHALIRKDIERLDTDVEVYFGVELCLPGWKDPKLVFKQELKDRLGFQFVIGGIHNVCFQGEYDLKKLVDIQHRHHLKTCQDPLVQVLVHPYWWNKEEFDNRGWPWFNSMKAVPEAYVRELGQVARETGTAIEINALSNLRNPEFSEDYAKEYFDYLSILAEEGVMFSLGSDAHSLEGLTAIQDSWQIVERLNLSQDRIWRPECKLIIS